jgi:integrase
MADNKDEKPKAEYTGLRALRHFYTSLCINRRNDGGLKLLAKHAQTQLGHSSIQVTFDTYDHLFSRGDGSAKVVEVERLLLV